MSENCAIAGALGGPTTDPGAIPGDGMADIKRPSSVTVSDVPTVRETLPYCSSQRAPLLVSRERSHLINTLYILQDGPTTPETKAPPKPSKEWAEPDHPGPLFIAKPRTPNGSFASDTVGVYQRVHYPNELPYVEKATPAAEGPDYPWLTSFQRKQMGIEDHSIEIKGRRNPSGGFFSTSEVASKVK